jgi:hypothetical protein
MAVSYEQLLSHDLQWALQEGSMHFEGKSAVCLTLEKITQRLKELNIPYAVAGGMALFFHGVRRFTEDVDILVRREDLPEIHRRLEGLGYVPVVSGGKNLRDAESGVRIEFIVTGDYPGDGKPKPVAFPEPGKNFVEKDGVCWLTLPSLIELKLASGMSNPARLKDLADVQELIRILNLPFEYREQLNPFVREKFTELCRSVKTNPADL